MYSALGGSALSDRRQTLDQLLAGRLQLDAQRDVILPVALNTLGQAAPAVGTGLLVFSFVLTWHHAAPLVQTASGLVGAIALVGGLQCRSAYRNSRMRLIARVRSLRGTPNAAGAALALLHDDQDPEVVLAIFDLLDGCLEPYCESLSQPMDDSHLIGLCNTVADADEPLAITALRVLGRYGDNSSIRRLESISVSSTSDLTSAAIQACVASIRRRLDEKQKAGMLLRPTEGMFETGLLRPRARQDANDDADRDLLRAIP